MQYLADIKHASFKDTVVVGGVWLKGISLGGQVTEIQGRDVGLRIFFTDEDDNEHIVTVPWSNINYAEEDWSDQ